MRSPRFVCVSVWSLGLVLALSTAVRAGDAQQFVSPAHWSAGDAGSTHQSWDVLTASTGNTPDVSHTTEPLLGVAPTLAVVGGLVSGSGNFYAPFGDYTFDAAIYNHGGTHGGGAAANLGTHVIIQTASTLNDNVGVLPTSLRIVDGSGNAILGGDNASALQSSVIWTGLVNSSFGEVTQEERIWEFFLPEFAGDFKVLADVKIHSSFKALQIDTMLAESAFATTTVPEPASVGLLCMGSVLLLRRRR